MLAPGSAVSSPSDSSSPSESHHFSSPPSAAAASQLFGTFFRGACGACSALLVSILQ